MKNIKSKNLIVIGTLALMLAQTSVALAYVPGVWDPQQASASTNQSAFTALPIIDTPAPAVAKSTNVVKPNANTATTNTKTVAKASTTNTAASNASTVKSTDANATNTNGNDLTALSLNGSGGFMPSSIFQWILVVFLILAIVIIARKLAKRNEAHEEELHMAHA